MNSFNYYCPTKIVFEENVVMKLAKILKEANYQRVFIVYGQGSVSKSGLLDKVTNILNESEIAYDLYGGVRPNPLLSDAKKGVKQALEFNPDLVFAIGGGSVIDCAKAIAVGYSNNTDDIWPYWLKEKETQKVLDVAVMLTIPAAGSETSDSAVLTNEETHIKKGLSSIYIIPKIALLDPSLALSVPKHHKACGIADIMMHTLDRYFNPIRNNEMTDVIATGLLRNVIKHGIKVVNEDNLHSMSEIMWAGSLSHNGITGLGNINDFACHQLGHPLSAIYDVTHGASLTAVWSSWANYCLNDNYSRFASYGYDVFNISRDINEKECAKKAIELTVTYFKSLGLPTTLSEVVKDIDESKIEELSLLSSYNKSRTIGSFKILNHNDIKQIYQNAI